MLHLGCTFGLCERWTPTYLSEQCGDKLVSAHVSNEKHLDFIHRNFKFEHRNHMVLKAVLVRCKQSCTCGEATINQILPPSVYYYHYQYYYRHYNLYLIVHILLVL